MGELGIAVSAGENRAVSFTNKQAAYFYTQTHRNVHPEHSWYRGLNLAGRRVFNDYRVFAGGVLLDMATAAVVVRPEAMVRTHAGGVVETLRTFDGRELLEVAVTGASGAVELRLTGDQLRWTGREDEIDSYVSSQGEAVDYVVVGRADARFLIAVGASRDAALELLQEAKTNGAAWLRERQERMAGLGELVIERRVGEGRVGEAHAGEGRGIETDDPQLTKALQWIALTMDELITDQRGVGIYAGLPWFNEYWGRDTFISLAGATLVTGQFEAARAILKSFAAFQELDRGSEFYGRVPNIVKPLSLDFHSADGTPRFVIALRDYVRYSGDRSLVKELYPVVVASIVGSLERWTDAAGYLMHGDSETWMDARRGAEGSSYSPRGNRANDVQALWCEQLRAGAECASMMEDEASAVRWREAAERVEAAFRRDFIEAAGPDFIEADAWRIADRLEADGQPDFTLRPNLLFALGLVADEETAARVLRRTWETLVFPWGVATLDPGDPFFHPYHLATEQYPKDEAYHNGTVWPWLSGIALQRMVEHGQVDAAWPLFEQAVLRVLQHGVVGGMAETMDACPHPGEPWPRLTGAFLQAWSNAEHLRVWFQYVLGVRPGVGEVIVLAPRMPEKLGAAACTVRMGAGTIECGYECVDGERRYAYRVEGRAATLEVDLSPCAVRRFAASAGDRLMVVAGVDSVHVRLVGADGTEKADATLPRLEARVRAEAMQRAVFDGVGFAVARAADTYAVMRAG